MILFNKYKTVDENSGENIEKKYLAIYDKIYELKNYENDKYIFITQNDKIINITEDIYDDMLQQYTITNTKFYYRHHLSANDRYKNNIDNIIKDQNLDVKIPWRFIRTTFYKYNVNINNPNCLKLIKNILNNNIDVINYKKLYISHINNKNNSPTLSKRECYTENVGLQKIENVQLN